MFQGNFFYIKIVPINIEFLRELCRTKPSFYKNQFFNNINTFLTSKILTYSNVYNKKITDFEIR